MAKKITTTAVSKGHYSSYRDKGRQFFSVMKLCLEDGEWDAVLLNGLHAAISMNDALCVLKTGRRSTGKSHQDAVILLGQACSSEEGRKNVGRLAQILNFKNEVEYEARRFTETEARDFSVKVDRFITWIESQLG